MGVEVNPSTENDKTRQKWAVVKAKARAKKIKAGEFRVVTRLDEPPVLLKITCVRLEEKTNGHRLIHGNCVLTGDSWLHGLYTEGQVARVGPPLNEMEVLAWVSR